jgi:hypothetical protein
MFAGLLLQEKEYLRPHIFVSLYEIRLVLVPE